MAAEKKRAASLCLKVNVSTDIFTDCNTDFTLDQISMAQI